MCRGWWPRPRPIPPLYRWSPVPQGEAAVRSYVGNGGVLGRQAGTALPYATVRRADGRRARLNPFLPARALALAGRPCAPRPRHVRTAAEIGYTWLSSSAIRTAANTEAKLLMLTYAFEAWQVLRVCLHTDARNERSRAAIQRIGGRFEGILRSHRLAADLIARDSARYSIVAAEWPELKARLTGKLDAHPD